MKRALSMIVLLILLATATYADTSQPDQTITRKAFIQALITSVKLEVKGTKALPFLDIQATDTGYAELQKAYSLGLITGASGTLFQPEARLTREQMAVILSRTYCLASGIDKTQLVFTAELLYKDQGGVSDWARTEMKLCHSLGLLVKDKEGYIRPQGMVKAADAENAIKTLTALTTKN